MNPNKAGLVLVALAAQWALADAPLPAVNKTPLALAGSAESKPGSRPGAALPGDVGRSGAAAARIGLLALNP
jgi:hypothetical protein